MIRILILSSFLLSCAYTPLTHSRVRTYDPQTGKKTQDIYVSPIMEWDSATRVVGSDYKIVKAGERIFNRAADKMPEYLEQYISNMSKKNEDNK